MKILVVDDEPMARQILAGALRAMGHEPEALDDPCAALERVRAGDVRLVITDWQMPGMSGPEMCRAVRAAGLTRYVYVVLLTARADRESMLEGLEAGADDFLTKPFDPAELRLRLKNAERLINLESRDLVILTLAKLAESRDHETGEHLERVRVYCRLLAERLAHDPEYAPEVTPEFVQLIYETSPLHDIGKVGIPDCVLLKQGRLDDAEFAVMRSHCQIGAETLGAALAQYPNASFLRMARDIALTHHEKWDGSGYPRGLRGAEIPLAGRVMAVADVYDALRAKRVYKASFEHLVCRRMILDGAGTHFDPGVVRAFDAVHERFDEIGRGRDAAAKAA
jgi:putative two-component system response regulator